MRSGSSLRYEAAGLSTAVESVQESRFSVLQTHFLAQFAERIFHEVLLVKSREERLIAESGLCLLECCMICLGDVKSFQEVTLFLTQDFLKFRKLQSVLNLVINKRLKMTSEDTWCICRMKAVIFFQFLSIDIVTASLFSSWWYEREILSQLETMRKKQKRPEQLKITIDLRHLKRPRNETSANFSSVLAEFADCSYNHKILRCFMVVFKRIPDVRCCIYSRRAILGLTDSHLSHLCQEDSESIAHLWD